jgi:hypothetical protein
VALLLGELTMDQAAPVAASGVLEAGGYWAGVTFATIVKARAKAPVLIFTFI